MLTVEKTNELLKRISNDSMELDENYCCEIAVRDAFAIPLRLSQEDGRCMRFPPSVSFPKTAWPPSLS